MPASIATQPAISCTRLRRCLHRTSLCSLHTSAHSADSAHAWLQVTDAFGNTIKVKGPKKKLSRKESKARDKARKARRERGEDVTPTDEDN